jgi:hypothetical protein
MNLPAMRRVVYSTCTVHERENEDVVRAVLADARLNGWWRQVDPMPSWPRRGTESSGEIGKLCLRTDPTLDRTSGFFVALFERDDSKMPPQQASNDSSVWSNNKRIVAVVAAAAASVKMQNVKSGLSLRKGLALRQQQQMQQLLPAARNQRNENVE